MFAAELNEYRVDGSDLDAVAPALVANLCSFYVVISVWLQESKRGKPLNELASRLRTRKTLEQLLKNQACGEDLISSVKRMLKQLDFGHGSHGVSAESERPDAGVNEQTHGLRVRSAL